MSKMSYSTVSYPLMEDPERFTVIIAGAGIAGLALANMLEKAKIDFIVLEKREIAPKIGASICVQCHTVKIFEQLGIWRTMYASTFPLIGRRHFDEQGRLFDDSPIFKSVMEKTKRPIVFLDRHFCLKTLYSNIKDKSKVRANAGVVSFTEDESGITVTTDSGQSIRGSILVAADGVHSTVRKLLADSVFKEDFDRYRDLVAGFTSSYRTVFGTSSGHSGNDISGPSLPNGIVHHVYYRNVSGITTAGAQGQIFWFLFIQEKIMSRSPNCPRYTDTDASATIEMYGDLIASPGYTFRDLWERRIKGGMVPMEEGVIQGPWNNGGRVVLVGDATSKTEQMTVNAGLGGNLAIEGACNLANELVLLVQGNQKPTTQDIVSAFQKYEHTQRPRAELSFKVSNYTTRYESMDSLWLRFVRWLSPWIPLWYKTRGILNYMEPAPILNYLPDPDAH
ncbi:FAD/NAD(P)-binding domain-containing protein [Hypoxylon sp. NC0597]|nr:FAD/NAD(P)-binding domain-containing protein [Hypoxylon sp. NC0597]